MSIDSIEAELRRTTQRNAPTGVAVTFYPFSWHLCAKRVCKNLWIAQVGPFGFVLSLQHFSWP